VRHLRLLAGDHTQARRVAIALGDALHTASFPEGDSGRWFTIRRLALGRIDPATSPASLALLLERVVRDATTRAVAFDTAGARTAETVTFPSRGGALAALARRHARHEDTSAWFWNQVVPGWREAASRAAQWGLLLNAAHQGEGAALIAATTVAAAVRAAAGAIGEIATAVSAQEAAFWLFAAGFDPVVGARGSSPLAVSLVTVLTEPLSQARAALRAAAGTRARDDDVRLVWLGTLLALDARSTHAARAELPATIAAWMQTQRGGSFTSAAANIDAPSVPAARLNRTPVTPEEKTGSQRSASAGTDVSLESSTPISGDCSHYAGLLFLVPVLQRLGLPRYLARDPALLDNAFPARLLAFIGRRAGMAEDDPLLRVLSELVDGAPEDRTPTWYYVAWLAAVRTWCRHRAKLRLRELVLRPGRVDATRAHLEVCFDPERADIRLRRLALDADPGWVRWLGWVIRFHYAASDERRP
jgi:hypothetical protein